MKTTAVDIIETVGLEAILNWVAEAYTITSIADTIGVTKYAVSDYLLRDEHKDAYALAKRCSAQVLQDEALSIADEQAEEGYKTTSASVQAAKLRSELRLKLASQRDRTLSERYTPPEERPVLQAPQGITFVINGVSPLAAKSIQQGITIDG